MKVLAIIGTYRKGGIVDTAIDEILASAKAEGAETEKIYLIDRHIDFCTNCRSCTQLPGLQRGRCVIADDMNSILETIENADAIVLGSPMNFGTVTAVMKQFIERLICFAYWPWGASAPQIRNRRKRKYAVLVASSAVPSFIARLSSRMNKLLKVAAGLLGAHTVGVIFIGLAARKERQSIGKGATEKARHLGKKLVRLSITKNPATEKSDCALP